MYDSILFPVDDSETGVVVDHVADVARELDAEVTVLFVADTGRDSVSVVEGDVLDVLEDEGEEIVDEVAARLQRADVARDTDVVQGDPAPTIVDYAERYGYDLVAMPTHGRRGISRRVLGSVTERVVRLSPLPVLSLQRDAETPAFPYERILLPTDGSDSATRATEHGIDLAAALDAEVHVLAVVDDDSLGPDVRSALAGEESERAAREAVERVAAAADDRGVASVEHVVRGSPADEIRTAIDATSAHAVVMGTTGKRGVDRILLGSVAERTVRSAPVPVVTLGAER